MNVLEDPFEVVPSSSALPEFFDPQAAWGGEYEKAEPYFLLSNYVAQEKLDGARYVIHKDDEGEVRIYSRGTSVKTGKPVIKTAQLQHIADEFNRYFPNGSVIDGEVVAPVINSSSNLVTTVTGASPEKALARQQEAGFVRYAAFDCLAYDGKVLTDLPLSERMEHLTVLLSAEKDSAIYYLPIFPGEDFKRHLYNSVVKRGGEGIILKDLTAPYIQGGRTKAWVKVKKEATFDVVFMGIEEAKGTSTKSDGTVSITKYAGQAGAIIYGQYVPQENGILVLTALGTTSGFDDALRLDVTKNAKVYTQKKLVFEVKANEQFKSGALRHPRFIQWRPDKKAADCILRIGEG